MSRNAGLANTYVYSLAVNSGGDIFAGCANDSYDGISRSMDYGNNWTKINSDLMFLNVKSLAINSSGDIFAGMDWSGGVYRSTDNGDSWQTRGLGTSTVNCLVVNSLDHLFAGTARDGIYRSEVGGAAWTQINNGLSNLEVHSIDFNSSGNLFAGTFGGGIYRSTNNGDNWTQINEGLTDVNVWSIAINPVGDIFLGTRDSGIFRSTDNGDTWIQVNEGLFDLNIRSLIINSSNQIFAGTQDDGIFRSEDNGSSWNQMSNGLTNTTILSLALDPEGYLYAGSDGSGVFRTVQTTFIKTNNNTFLKSFELFQNYPNPFNPITVISWQLAVGSNVELTIYNILGQKVKTLFNKYMPAGYHEVKFTGQNLSSGIYLYRIETGGWTDTKKMLLVK